MERNTYKADHSEFLRSCNTESASLIRLPQEIQDHIYTHVLGHGTICIRKCPCFNLVVVSPQAFIRTTRSGKRYSDAHSSAWTDSVRLPFINTSPAVKHKKDCRFYATIRPPRYGFYRQVTNNEFPCFDEPVTEAARLKSLKVHYTNGGAVSLSTYDEKRLVWERWHGQQRGCVPATYEEHSLTLLWTCRHIYKSAMPLLFLNLCFRLQSRQDRGWDTEIPKLFCAGLRPSYSALLRSISVCIYLAPRSSSWHAHSDDSPGADFFEATNVLGDWKEMIEGNTDSGFEGFAAFTGLRSLAIEFNWMPSLTLYRKTGEAFSPVLLPFLHALEGVKALGVAQLHVIFWTWHSPRFSQGNRSMRWHFSPLLGQRVKAKLLGSSEENDNKTASWP